MYFIGYYLSHGHSLDSLLKLNREERILYGAIARLNDDKEKKNFYTAIHDAIVDVWNQIHGK